MKTLAGLIAIWILVTQVIGQTSERFDCICMIKEREWIDDIRNLINDRIKDIEEYGLIIVHTNSNDTNQFSFTGLRQTSSQPISDDPFARGTPDRFLLGRFTHEDGKLSDFKEKHFTAMDYAKAVRIFHAATQAAGIDSMPSKSGADEEYYVFSKLINPETGLAIGDFRSCVLVNPAKEHAALQQFEKLVRMHASE